MPLMSPGAAASDAILEVFARQAQERQQALLNEYKAKAEQRMQQEDAWQHEDRQQQAEQRKLDAADRAETAKENARIRREDDDRKFDDDFRERHLPGDISLDPPEVLARAKKRGLVQDENIAQGPVQPGQAPLSSIVQRVAPTAQQRLAAQKREEQRTYLDTMEPGPIKDAAEYEFNMGKTAPSAALNDGPAGSDFKQYLNSVFESEAAKRRISVTQLTPEDRITITESARKKFGQADDTAPRGWAPTIYIGPTGPQLVDKTTGTAKPITGADQQPIGNKLPGSLAERVAKIDQTFGSIGEIERLAPVMKDNIGLWDGIVSKGRVFTGMGITANLATLDAEVNALRNTMITAITGAAVGVQEAQRIMGQIPDLKQPEEVFFARLASSKQNLEFLKQRILELTGAGTPSGRASGAGPGAPPMNDAAARAKALIDKYGAP